MTSASAHLRRLAQRIVDEAIAHVPARAALLAGSAGRGDADAYSDIDLLIYVDEVPPWEVLDAIVAGAGGIQATRKPTSTEEFRSEEFELQGVHGEVVFVALAWMERRLDELLTRVEDFDSPSQKILSGLLEGLALLGPETIDRWKTRAQYPESLRRPMIERHWRFFPLWYYQDAMPPRDAELWRLDSLLSAAFDLLAILAGLNRVYLARFQLKRTREIVAQMRLTPPHLADRLESLVRLEPHIAAHELALLVIETRDLVLSELPEVDLPLPFGPDARIQPWGTQA